MKRALLIAGGTVGGLGAVLAITPPQLNQTTEVAGLAGTPTGATNAASSTSAAVAPAATTQSSAAPVATKASATKKAVATKSAQATTQATASASASATQSASAAPTPSATKTTAAPSTGGYSGTVTGASFNARNYGTLSATVTFANGKITNVSASQSPSSWSQQSLSALIPYVNGGKITVEQIKQYSASQLPCSTQNSCRSQASFTAEAFWSSIKSAISKAGL
jgi:Zn-dependent alcohol dehydrogenase